MNDNNEVKIVERAIDEIELVLLTRLDELAARRMMVQIIPIIGQLIRDVMSDTADSIMKVINEVKEM